jgi:hypothetical protein
MNPGYELGLTAVIACYTIVLGSLLLYLKMTSSRQKRLEKRRKELKGR